MRPATRARLSLRVRRWAGDRPSRRTLPNVPDPPPGVRSEPSSRGGIAALGGDPLDASAPDRRQRDGRAPCRAAARGECVNNRRSGAWFGRGRVFLTVGREEGTWRLLRSLNAEGTPLCWSPQARWRRRRHGGGVWSCGRRCSAHRGLRLRPHRGEGWTTVDVRDGHLPGCRLLPLTE